MAPQPETQSIFKRHRWLAPVLVLAGIGVVFFAIFTQVRRVNVPEDFANDEAHFKYGSIGSDYVEGRGVPYWLWRAMPQVCSDILPGGYASLGFLYEPDMDRPIGFSKRRTGPFDSVGLNCAACHTASVRESAGAPAKIYLAAASHQLDLWRYFDFLFACGKSPGFTEERLMAAIESMTKLSFFDRIVYHRIFTRTGPQLADQSQKLAWVRDRPAWGPGRVDTFNPYRSLVFNVPVPSDSVGTADFPPIWSQAIRAQLFVHWDGNNSSVAERNLSATIGAGATFDSLDFPRLERIRQWIWNLDAPRYPFAIDRALAASGKPLYDEHCARCHEAGGKDYNAVSKNDYIKTDPYRSNAFNQDMANLMNQIGKGYPWQFKNFRPTGGYVNHPLDGVWLRAPYLHNGSVPTLRDLLNPASARPAKFYRGGDVYDQQKLGFVSDQPTLNGRALFEFDTSGRGNGSTGHEYGVELSDAQKSALVEYMKLR